MSPQWMSPDDSNCCDLQWHGDMWSGGWRVQLANLDIPFSVQTLYALYHRLDLSQQLFHTFCRHCLACYLHPALLSQQLCHWHSTQVPVDGITLKVDKPAPAFLLRHKKIAPFSTKENKPFKMQNPVYLAVWWMDFVRHKSSSPVLSCSTSYSGLPNQDNLSFFSTISKLNKITVSQSRLYGVHCLENAIKSSRQTWTCQDKQSNTEQKLLQSVSWRLWGL